MFNTEHILDIKEIVDNSDNDTQLLVAIEELSELQKAITKIQRNRDIKNDSIKRHCINNLVEELADVHIMLAQIQMIFEIGDYEIEQIIERKIDKVLGRY